MDLLKVYDCLLRDLLIAKSKAHGLNNNGLNLLFYYISFRKTRTKVGFSYSNGQILYVKFFRVNIRATFAQYIFINDTFMKFEIFQMIILFSWGEKSTKFKKNFIFDTKNNLNWSRPNSLKANPGNFKSLLGISLIIGTY